MDAQHHTLLDSLDTTKTIEHAAARKAWADGPYAEWQKKLREIPIGGIGAWKATNPPPAPPPEPLLTWDVLRNVAATHGVTVDDLVRCARGMEVRTSYSVPGALHVAKEALGADICEELKALAWPDLPPLPPPPRPRATPTVRQ